MSVPGFAGAIARLLIALEDPLFSQSFRIRLQEAGDYLAARALDQARTTDLVLLLLLAGAGTRPLPLADRRAPPDLRRPGPRAPLVFPN